MLRVTEESPAADGGFLIIDESDHLFIDLPSPPFSSPLLRQKMGGAVRQETEGRSETAPPPPSSDGWRGEPKWGRSAVAAVFC